MWCHRQTKAADWYFVAAPAQHGFRGSLGFRSQGKAEVWNPVTGTVSDAGAVSREGAYSRVALDIPPAGACFVVFRQDREEGPTVARVERDGVPVIDTRAAAQAAPLPQVEPAVTVPKVCEVVEGGKALLAWEPGRYRVTRADGSAKEYVGKSPRRVPLSAAWNLAFPQGWDAPESVCVASLQPWMAMDLPAAAKAFSGTASYTTEFSLDALPAGARAELDLGRVEMIASVRVNGVSAGTVWATPYRLDVTSALKPGLNRLTVEVTSSWFNRLVFDAGLPESARKTWTIKGPDKASPLRPSGLLGPVTLCVGQRLAE